MELLLSAHELSALMLIEQFAGRADLDRGAIEQLISRRLVEHVTAPCGAPELKVTENGNLVLRRISASDRRQQDGPLHSP